MSRTLCPSRAVTTLAVVPCPSPRNANPSPLCPANR